jgi:ABC-type sugar transport system substrate-binding protein
MLFMKSAVRHRAGLSIAIVGLLVASVVLAACGGSSSSSSSSTTSESESKPSEGSTKTTSSGPKPSSFENYMETLAPPGYKPPKKTYKIALVTASTVLPQQKSLEVGVEEAAKEAGVELTTFDAGGFENISKQVSQFETAIGEHPDAILVLPASPVALNAQIKQAESAGIKVLPMLIPPPTAKFDFALADDLPLDAKKSIESLSERLGGKGDLYAIIGGAGSTVAQLFKQGMEETLKENPGLKVVFTKNLPGYTVSEAQKAAEGALVSQPEVDGIVTNDTILGVGAAKALELDGKSGTPIAGIGPGDEETVDALKSGQITVGATPPFYAVGFQSVHWATSIIEGLKPKENVITINPMVLTQENIEEAISTEALFQVLAPSAVGCGPGQSEEC